MMKNLNDIKFYIQNEPHDFGSAGKRKKAVNDHFADTISFQTRHGEDDFLQFDGFTNPILDRRKRALLNYLERPDEELQDLGIKGYEDLFLSFEAGLNLTYEVLDEERHFIYGAAIWILDELKRNGTIWKAFRYLPEEETLLYDEICPPWDINDTEYDFDLILSVVYVLMKRNDDKLFVFADERTAARPENFDSLPKSKNRRNFEGLMSLLDETRVQEACRHYEKAHEELLKRYMASAKIFLDRERNLRDQLGRSKSVSLLSPDLSGSVGNIVDKIEELSDNRNAYERFRTDFPDLMIMDEQEIRERTGKRKIARILSGYTVDDPFELCFALFALIDQGSDIPWLFGSSGAVINAVGALLPWYYAESDDDDYFDEDDEEPEKEAVPEEYRRKEAGVPEPVDFYHTGHSFKGKKWNLAQILFEITNGLPLRGTHPFEEYRDELLENGMEESLVTYIISLAETIDSATYKKQADNLRGESAVWKILEGINHREAPEDAAEDEEDEILPDEEVGTDGTDAEDESDDREETIRRLKQENKNLRKVLSENNAAFTKRIGKAELELKALRLEHRELSDLRTILFNKENEAEEPDRPKTDKAVSFPYTPVKQTVVFGGHDSFLKAIKPMLPEVRFVDTANLSFDTMILRNTDIIWIQNNCISHSQYWRAIGYARQHGIQVRYFAYASAEKCAEQLALEDRK